MGIFNSKKKTRVTEQDKAILQLKQQRDQLKQYQKRIDIQLIKDRELAKQLVSDGKKERAMVLLRKKRFLEQQLSKADGMIENVEKMTQDLEYTQVELKVIENLKSGNVALKQLNQLLSIQEIEQIMDETKEGIEKQQEIDAILHGQLTDEDEAAAEEELSEILNAIPNLPEVPDTELIAEPTEPTKEIEKSEKKREKVLLPAM